MEVAICGDEPKDQWLGDFPIPTHALGPGLGKYAYTPRLADWLRAKGRSYDAWVINGLWQYQGFAGSRVATQLGIPYFIYAHGMLDPWNRRAAPAKYVKKLLYWLVAERFTMEKATAVVFTSLEESKLAKHYFPIANWNELVVGNGIAEPPHLPTDHRERFRAELSIPEGKRLLLFLSRIHPKKGLDQLLLAFSRLPSLRERAVLVIVGDGDKAYVDSLKRMSADLRIDESVRWAGPLYDERKWVAFSSAELFVLPSHQENFGIAIAESLSMGTPVCTTTGVNTYPLVESYRAGLVCRDNKLALVNALRIWQSMSADKIRTYRENARRCFEEELGVDRASQRLLDAIETAVEARRKRKNGGVH